MLLGKMRMGPDLANIGKAAPAEEEAAPAQPAPAGSPGKSRASECLASARQCFGTRNAPRNRAQSRRTAVACGSHIAVTTCS